MVKYLGAVAVAACLLAGCSAGGATRHPSISPGGSPAPSARSTAPGPHQARDAMSSSPSAASAAASTRATPRPVNYCASNTHPQLILVSIRKQHAWMCTRSRTVFSTSITSGAVDLPDRSTPTGNFEIQGRSRDTVLTLNTGAQYHVKYWIPFSGPLFGFHDASWQNFPFGSAKYRTQGSHGCVHMPVAAMAYLYTWAATGASVRIRT